MKKEYFEEKKKRIRQKIKVLVSMPIFQEEIMRLRKKWNIPTEGIKTEEENQNWNIQLDIATDEFDEKEWPKWRTLIQKLRNEGKYREADEKNKEFIALRPLADFNNDLWSVVRKYKLSPRWHNGIRRYLLFNDPENLQIAAGVSIKMNWENGMKLLGLEIDGDTTISDIKHVWPLVKRLQKNLNYRQAEKFQPIHNFDRDKRAYDLQQEGRSMEEIGDIILNEFGDALDYNELNIAINRCKKRLNIN